MEARKQGDLVIQSMPYSHVLSHNERGKRCDECFKRVDNLQRCSACGFARYCNKACQRNAWRFHKAECKGFQLIKPNIPQESMLLMLRLILRHQAGEDEHLLENTPEGNMRCFNHLMDHANDIENDANRMEQFAYICHALKLFMGAVSLPPVSKLLQIFGRMVTNTFSICDGEMQPIGSGLYIGPSAIDHSCSPNSVATFKGVQLSVRLVRSLTSEDEKITISYLDQLMSCSERKQLLEEQYYFTCKCKMCNDIEVTKTMLGMRCLTDSCNGVCIDFEDEVKCQICGYCWSDDVKIRRDAMIQASSNVLKKLKKLQRDGKCEELLATAEQLIAQQKCLFHDVNVYMTRAYDTAMDACIDLHQWHKAIDYCHKSLLAYRLYYHECHPSIAIQLAKLGKLLFAIDETNQGRNFLEQACSILAVSHGEDHSLYADCVSLLCQ